MNQIELLSPIKVKELYGLTPSNDQVTALVNDHREVVKGSCFIAIRGYNFDGHSVLAEVIEHGARILVVEEVPKDINIDDVVVVKVESTQRIQALLANIFYQEPSKQLKVVAVTGTNGKTTTSTLISELLEELNHTTGLIGTNGYKIADEHIPSENTTPNSLRLQSLFKQMVDSNCDDAVIEASSHALQLGRLSYTDVDCAIFTNLTREHLDFHKTMEHYAYAKSLLFSQLGQSLNKGTTKLSIINLDSEFSELMMEVTSSELATYSLSDTNATVYASEITENPEGIEFKLHYNNRVYYSQIPMLGEYNVSNYLAAFLCLTLFYGYSAQAVIDATDHFNGVEGRMQIVDLGQPFKVIVDFAHTPDALDNVLSSLITNKENRLIAMMGHSGGNRDSGMRPELGDILFKYADVVVLTADNPRNENVEKICREMLGNHNEKEYFIIPDRKEAIHTILDFAEVGDTILFAGKGAEPYQIVGENEEHLPYNEVEIIENYLKKTKGV